MTPKNRAKSEQKMTKTKGTGWFVKALLGKIQRDNKDLSEITKKPKASSGSTLGKAPLEVFSKLYTDIYLYN